jgi:hypothetical protein
LRLRHDVSDAEPAFFELIEEQGQSLHRHQAPVVEQQDAFALPFEPGNRAFDHGFGIGQ